MSEVTESLNDQLNRTVRFTLSRDNVIPFPIDPTLSIEGEAADAKAVGDAIANISSVKKVNNQSPNASGEITVNATQIPMSNEAGAQSIAEAMNAAQGATGETIKRTSETEETIEEGMANIEDAITNGCTDEEIDALFEDEEEEE